MPIQGQCVLYRDEKSGYLKRCRVISKDTRIFECIDSGEKFHSISSPSIFEFPYFGKNCFPALAVYAKFGNISKLTKNTRLVTF